MSDKVLFFPAQVRRQVLDQHIGLRDLFQRVLVGTTRALRHEPCPGQDELLTRSMEELHRRFNAHLVFEERALAPILQAADSWGPERVTLLLEEHERQRAELDTIMAGIDEGWDEERLALVMRSLVRELLHDMAEEETGLLDAPALLEDLAPRPEPSPAMSTRRR